MKKHLYLFILMFCIASCKKTENDNAEPGLESNCNQIKEVWLYNGRSEPNNKSRIILTYDKDNRVSSSEVNKVSKVDYKYYSDKIELTGTSHSNEESRTTFYLDNKGRITRSNLLDHDFKYNTSGYLISYKQPYGSNGEISGYHPFYLEYENENLTKMSTPDENNSNKLITFKYYNEPNQDIAGLNSPIYLAQILPEIHLLPLISQGYFGKQSKNLLQALDFHNQSSTFSDFIYQYNTKGRITKASDYTIDYNCD